MENLEEFVDIEGYEGYYKINKNGDIFSVKRNKILKPYQDEKGYCSITLYKDGKKKGFSIDILIQLHFKENLEEFVNIRGYEGFYKINKNGDVLNVKRNRLLKPVISSDGYYKVCLCKDGTQKSFSIHRLIGLHFLPNLENLEMIDHIDRNKQNNNINNLRWVTRSENCKNVEIKGCIYKYKTYYRVEVRRKYIKYCKTYEEAQEFLKKYLKENENN